MKLYDCSDGTKFRVIGDIEVPIGAPPINKGDEYTLRNIDGMYSYCKDVNGAVVHLIAWAEVEIVEP